MAKRALVTGATGQDGSYLVDLLLARGYEVHAQSRQQRGADRAGVIWHAGDLTNSEFLVRLIKTAEADEIYNLAAVSQPLLSWSQPIEAAQLNALVPQQICEAIRQHAPNSRLFQASSSAIYGDGAGTVQNETTRCDPHTPYGIAKYYAHRVIGVYRERYPALHLSSGILFNHESPRRPLYFVAQKIAHAAAAVHLGLTETKETAENDRPLLSGGKVKLGNLEVRRDFGYAGDYVEAIHAMLQSDTPDDYVIGTGESHSIAEVCETAFGLVGRDWHDHVEVDSELVRPGDARVICADASKLRNRLGWRPKLSFGDLVKLMVEHRIEAIRSGR